MEIKAQKCGQQCATIILIPQFQLKKMLAILTKLYNLLLNKFNLKNYNKMKLPYIKMLTNQYSVITLHKLQNKLYNLLKINLFLKKI
jgi:hypothetical protein